MPRNFTKTATALLSMALSAASGQAAPPKPAQPKPVVLAKSDFHRPHAGFDGCRFDAAGDGPVKKVYVLTADIPLFDKLIPPKTAFFDLGRNSDIVVVSGKDVTVSGKDLKPETGDGRAYILNLQGGKATLVQVTDELVQACAARQRHKRHRRRRHNSDLQF